MIDYDKHYMCNDTCRIVVGKDIDFLLGIMNSHLFFYAIKTYYGGGGLGDHGVRMKHTFFERFQCVDIDKKLLELIHKRLSSNNDSIDNQINNKVYELYNLNPDEIAFIENNVR